MTPNPMLPSSRREGVGLDHHYVVAKTPTVIQVSGSGPFDMTYINPDDDPQKAKK